MQNLFVYGTLMCEDIMEEVSGCCQPCIEGWLKGYCRRAVKREQYPAVFPDENGIVAGMIYLNVPSSALDRLDRFEGEMYMRQSVDVEFDYGEVLPAETYVIRPEFYNILEAFDWNYENFLARGKKIFRERFRGYRTVERSCSQSVIK